MKKGIYILPNSVTLCGMFFGFYAIISALHGDFIKSAWAIVIAGVFDALDGWVARLTSSTTKFGIELDSLSDVIAFGVAPAALLYKWALHPFGRIGWAVAFLFVACGAMRLARFNIQMGGAERKSFTGMPIPAAAGFNAALIMFCGEIGWEPGKNVLILLNTIMLSLFMVSTMRFHSLKEIDLKKRKPFWLLVFVVLMVALLVMHPEFVLMGMGAIYLSTAIIENSYLLIKNRSAQPEAK